MPAPGTAADLAVVPPGTNRPKHVIVAGRLVVENGALLTGNIEKIRAEAGAEAQKLWKRMAEIN
jgi:hypothetical protein